MSAAAQIEQLPLIGLGQVCAGDPLWALDASGEWREKCAASGVESAGPPKRHDFAGIYVRNPGGDPQEPGIFWPLEDLRVRP
jgi:hypothetical protein